MDTKICSKCAEELKIDKFYKNKNYKDGFFSYCKKCADKKSKIYRENNKEKLDKYDKQYRKENTNKHMIYTKQYYEKNREKELERVKKYREDKLDKYRIYGREYYKNNKKTIAKKVTEWRKNNKVKFNIRNNISCKKYKSQKLALPSNLTIDQWELIKLHFDNKCAYCGKEFPLAQEHFVAVTKGGEFSQNNIIPSCKNCNSSKYDKDFFEWYPNYKHYSKDREKIILEFLNYKNGQQQLALII